MFGELSACVYLPKEPVTKIVRADSEHSMGGESDDQDIMEGGVTIRRHVQKSPKAVGKQSSQFRLQPKAAFSVHC